MGTPEDSFIDLAELLEKFESSLSPEDLAEAQCKIQKKDAIRRFTEHVDLLNEAIRAGGSVLSSELVDDPERLGDLINHIERLWDDAAEAFFRGRHSTALFLSIVVLEETGKVGVLRFVLALAAVKASGPALSPRNLQRSKNPLFSHRRKHLLAAGAGALVNSRLDRILSEAAVVGFLEKVEAGEIESLRQACLYAEDRDGTLYIPDESIGEASAQHYLVLSGEIMAEVLGWVPADFERLINKVSAVEVRLGLGPDLVKP